MKTKKVLVSLVCLVSFLFAGSAFAVETTATTPTTAAKSVTTGAKYYMPVNSRVRKHMSARVRNKKRNKYCLFASKSFNVAKCSRIYK